MSNTVRKQSPVSLTSIRNILTLRYDPEKTNLEKQLQLRDFDPIDNGESAPQKIEAILKNEIKLRVDKAKNVAIPIGSGIDSAVILALAKEVAPKKNIFGVSLGFAGAQDETSAAKKICDVIGTKCYVIHANNVLMDLPLQVSIVGEPRWNLWYYYVLEHAKTLGADMMLTGDGGDELFGGYVFRYSKYLSILKNEFKLPTSLNASDISWVRRAWAYLQCHDRDWVPDQERIFGSRMSELFKWDYILRYFKPYFDNDRAETDLSQVFLADFNGKLVYDWIPTNASLSRYFGIRMSSPFLSETMVDYAPHIPFGLKYDLETQQGKLVLRKILEKYGLLEHVGKNKLGFGMDLVSLWESHGSKVASEYLEEARICKEQLVDANWLRVTLQRLRTNKDLRYINKVLQLVSLEIWYRIFVSKTMSQKVKLC